MKNFVEAVLTKSIEVKPVGEDGFRKIKETLTRMGVASRSGNVLSQSAHILHKRGRFYIMHFKELMQLDGLDADLTSSDIARRNRIAQMLEDWGLLEIISRENLDPMGAPNVVCVIKYADREKWTLVPKYTIGVKKVFRGRRNERAD